MFPINNIDFVTPISSSYDRNNKSTGHKSLRCFPSCRSSGHVVRGYCGQPIVTEFEVPHEIGVLIETQRMLVVAEIHSTNVAGLSSCTQLISAAIILDNVRVNNSTNKNPIFGGEVDRVEHIRPASGSDTGSTRLRVSFNKESQSWNYGWLSNRWNTESHVVEIILFGHVGDFYPVMLRLAGSNSAAAAAVALVTSSGASVGGRGGSAGLDEEERCSYAVLGSFQSSEFVICCTKDVSAGKEDRNARGHSEASRLKADKKRAVLEQRVRKLGDASRAAAEKGVTSKKARLLNLSEEPDYESEADRGDDDADEDDDDANVAFCRPAVATSKPQVRRKAGGGDRSVVAAADLLGDLHRTSNQARPAAAAAAVGGAAAGGAAAGGAATAGGAAAGGAATGGERTLSSAQQRQLLLLQQLQYDILVGGKDLDLDLSCDQNEVMRLLNAKSNSTDAEVETVADAAGSTSNSASVATVVSEGEAGDEPEPLPDQVVLASLLALSNSAQDGAAASATAASSGSMKSISEDASSSGPTLVVKSSAYDFNRRRCEEARALVQSLCVPPKPVPSHVAASDSEDQEVRTINHRS